MGAQMPSNRLELSKIFAMPGTPNWPPTAYTVEELVARYNAFDWTDGLLVRQARIQPVDEAVCHSPAIGRTCYPELLPEYARTTHAKTLDPCQPSARC